MRNLQVALIALVLVCPLSAMRPGDPRALPICSGSLSNANVACASAPVPISLVLPRYTEAERDAGFEARVPVSMIIDEHGKPRNLHPIGSLDQDLAFQVVSALENSRFKPGYYHDQATPVKATLTIYFADCRTCSTGVAGMPASFRTEEPGAPRGLRKKLEKCGKDNSKSKACPLAVLIHLPESNDLLRQRPVEGKIALSFTIDRQGRPEKIQVEHGFGGELDRDAVKALDQWRFRPSFYRGRTYAVHSAVELRYGACANPSVTAGTIQ